MKAVVLEETGPRLVEDRPEPIAAEGEVAVDVIEAGICETDLQLVAGYMGYRGVLGHEFVGVPHGTAGRAAGGRGDQLQLWDLPAVRERAGQSLSPENRAGDPGA